MSADIRKTSKRTVSGIIAISVIAVMLLAMFPATAGPGPLGATVTGTVTDINDGEPIDNALVVISYHDIERSTLTDENGRYTFRNVPECYCLKKVTASKDGYRPETKEVGVSGVTVVDFELLLMEKEPYTGAIVGTVTDINDGTPIDDAKVTIEYHGIVRETYTDSQGDYRFDEVPECFCLKKVTASKEHYVTESQDVAVSGVTVVDFELMMEELPPPDGTLHGIVTDSATGEPIEGALVVLRHEGDEWSTLTDEEGYYELTGIPICRCPKDVSVSAEGYVGLETSLAVSEDTVADFNLEPAGGKEDPEPGPRIVVGFPGAGDIPERISEHPVATTGLVGASVALLAAGLYARIVKQ